MLIGLLSDTHGYFHPALPEYLADVDLILHAGDVGDPIGLGGVTQRIAVAVEHDGFDHRRPGIEPYQQ